MNIMESPRKYADTYKNSFLFNKPVKSWGLI